MTEATGGSRLTPELFEECAGWIWEQIQEEGHFLSGELIEMIMKTERDLATHTKPVKENAAAVIVDLERRGIVSVPAQIGPEHVEMVLYWEDDFLGLAGISREET